MKAYFLWTVTGPQVVLSSCDLVTHPECLKNLANVGVTKFVAYELSLDLVKEKYGEHYSAVVTDPNGTDELRILDTDGVIVLNNFSFKDLGEPIYYESEQAASMHI